MRNNIPLELRQLPQWVVARADKSPVDPKTEDDDASVTDPTTWAAFDVACAYADRHSLRVGFVLAESDPYTIIDLDDKPERPATDEQKARFAKIIEKCDSYTERSSSGRGVHIIVRGAVPSGIHRDKVEVYSDKRYMICTGDVLRPLPIADRQDLLDVLYGEMKPADVVELDEAAEEELSDEDLVDMAMRAANADKFNALCSCTGDQGEGPNKVSGSYTELGYESQSEADFALLSILAFYTKNNEQVRRIFRMSDLGKRAKAVKNNRYLDTSLRKIRAQQEGEARDAEEFRQIHAEDVAGLAAVRPSPQAQPSVLAHSPASRPEGAATSAFAWPRALMTRSLDTVQMRAIDWLWTGWIPKGYITIWAGETGAGKSTVLADVAARVSTGAPWPGDYQPRQPGRVLWLGSEDGIEELTVPRLAACGANCANIVEIQGVVQDGKRRTFSLQDDLANVKAELKHARDAGHPFALLVIDPVTSYLPGQKLRKVDLNDAGQLRTILEPWLVLAQEYTLAIVCVTHFAKDTQRSMLHRVLGSAAFTQTCRSLCTVVSRPDEGPFEKALVQVKINLPEHPGGGWKFSTRKVRVGIDSRTGASIDATRAEWEELDQALTPESFMGGERGPVAKAAPAFSFWVKQYFAALPPGTHPTVADVKAAALANGIVGESWWNKNSGDFLQKWNDHGTWYCMPRPSASQAFNN